LIKLKYLTDLLMLPHLYNNQMNNLSISNSSNSSSLYRANNYKQKSQIPYINCDIQVPSDFQIPSKIIDQNKSAFPNLLRGNTYNFRRYKRFPHLYKNSAEKGNGILNQSFQPGYKPSKIENNFELFRRQIALNYRNEMQNQIQNNSRTSSPTLEKIKEYAIRGQNPSHIKVKTLINQRVQLPFVHSVLPQNEPSIVPLKVKGIDKSHRIIPSMQFEKANLQHMSYNQNFEKDQKVVEYSRILEDQVFFN